MKKYLLLFFLCKLCCATCFAQPVQADPIVVNNYEFRFGKNLTNFYNTSNGRAALFIPRQDSVAVSYGMSYWFSALDSIGNKYVASQTYGNNKEIDFKAGLIGSACDLSTQNISFTYTKAEMELHRSYASNSNYIVPSKIADYPASGLPGGLVPYKDYNGNNLYEPQLGEHPDFPGDFATYLFNNDAGLHAYSGGLALDLDIVTLFYGYAASNDPAIQNTLFIKQKVANRSNRTYSDFRQSNWIDFDLGNPNDDFLGTHVDLNTIYVYNGDDLDDINGGPAKGYGTNPPAFGLVYLSEPLDNSWFFNVFGATNDSIIFNYARFKKSNGTPQYYFGLSEGPSSEYKYVFPDNSDPTGRGFVNGKPASYPAWTETSQNNPPGDRRMYGSTAGRSLAPGEVACYVNALVWSRNSNASTTDGGRKALFLDLPKVRNFYNQNITCD